MSYKNIVATIGTYNKNGETKYITRTVGKLMETQHGEKVVLDASFNPAGCIKGEDGQVWLSIFTPKPKQSYGGQDKASGNVDGGMNGGIYNDDAPF